jgi:MFS family permease
MERFWVRRHPRFLTLLASRLISRIGDVLYTLAATWSVLTGTHSILSASLVPMLSLAPDVLLALPLATLADRWPKKPVMVGTDLVRAAVVGAAGFLMLRGSLPTVALYGLTLALNVGGLLYGPAASAMIRLTVPDTRLTDANGLWQSALSVLSVLSYGLGGVLIALLSPARALLLDGASFLLGALVVAAATWPDARATASSGGFGFLRDALAGLRYIGNDRVLRHLLFVLAPVNVLFGPILILSAALSDRVLHTGTVGFGLMEMGAGMGSIVAGLVVGWTSRRASFTVWLLALLGTAALAMGGSALARNLWVTVGLYVLAWAVSGVFNIPFLSAIEGAVPVEEVGRVMQTLFLVFSGVTVPLGLLVGSLAMDRFGVVPVLYCEAILYGLMAASLLVYPIRADEGHPVFAAYGPSPRRLVGDPGSSAAGSPGSEG